MLRTFLSVFATIFLAEVGDPGGDVLREGRRGLGRRDREGQDAGAQVGEAGQPGQGSTADVQEENVRKDLELLWMCGLPGYGPGDLIDLSFEGGNVDEAGERLLSMGTEDFVEEYFAAMPDDTTTAPAPPSSLARVSASSVRVGLLVRV